MHGEGGHEIRDDEFLGEAGQDAGEATLPIGGPVHGRISQGGQIVLITFDGTSDQGGKEKDEGEVFPNGPLLRAPEPAILGIVDELKGKEGDAQWQERPLPVPVGEGGRQKSHHEIPIFENEQEDHGLHDAEHAPS